MVLHENSNILDQLLMEPELAIEKLDLIYTGDEQLSILREKQEKDFNYIYKGRPLSSKNHLKRIESLVIPPAWNDVKIADLPNGHLQAVGRDKKKRKQYRYHEVWSKVRNQTKFYKMVAFGKKLPDIRNKVDSDLSQKGWPRSKVLALVIRLMEETHIRIGNEQYAKRNKTYGLSTLRKKHVDIDRDKVKFSFTGKRGKDHNITLKNKRLINLVSRCEEIPGWELFQFYDTEGNKQQVESGMVNKYIHEICGDIFTAKDFRTWAGTLVFFETLMELGMATDESLKKKNILQAYDKTAKALGNTRNVCRKYYVHPLIPASYEEGTLVETFKLASDTKETQYFSSSESALLKKIKNYKPLEIKKQHST